MTRPHGAGPTEDHGHARPSPAEIRKGCRFPKEFGFEQTGLNNNWKKKERIATRSTSKNMAHLVVNCHMRGTYNQFAKTLRKQVKLCNQNRLDLRLRAPAAEASVGGRPDGSGVGLALGARDGAPGDPGRLHWLLRPLCFSFRI